MLTIGHPDTYSRERKYIHHVIFSEFLGVEYREYVHEHRDIRIALEGDPDRKTLTLADELFAFPRDSWLTSSTLPKQPLCHLSTDLLPFKVPIQSASIPVIFGCESSETFIVVRTDGIHLGIDILGSCFFMLSRYEEAVVEARDRYDRFSAFASLAYKEGFLNRPIVNEYLEILWGALKSLWPSLKRKVRSYRFLLSHDVDWPIVTLRLPWRRILKSAAGDILIRKEPSLAARRLLAGIQSRRGTFEHDPGNVFDFIMLESERRAIRSSFYFITAHSGRTIDGTYRIDEPLILQLLRSVHARNHEIGLHPSFNTYRDPKQTEREFGFLKATCENTGIFQKTWGGRQHYLRWKNPDTWRNWAEAGLDYDSSVGFADQVGFRTGVCYEYPVYDLHERKQLPLRERPLIVMEGTLFKTTSPSYMALPDMPGLAQYRDLVATVKQYSGDFTLLWHNSALISKRQRALYLRCLDLAVEGF